MKKDKKNFREELIDEEIDFYKKNFREEQIDEEIDFLEYLKYDLSIKFWCKPSKVFLINSMIKDTITRLRCEKLKLKFDRR